MSVNRYLVYDKDSGEVIHLHVEQGDLRTKPEEVLQATGLQGDPRLEVLQVQDGHLPARPARVKGGEVRHLEEEGDMGMAGEIRTSPLPEVERRYERREHPKAST